MADVINIHGDDEGPKPLVCPSCDGMKLYMQKIVGHFVSKTRWGVWE